VLGVMVDAALEALAESIASDVGRCLDAPAPIWNELWPIY